MPEHIQICDELREPSKIFPIECWLFMIWTRHRHIFFISSDTYQYHEFRLPLTVVWTSSACVFTKLLESQNPKEEFSSNTTGSASGLSSSLTSDSTGLSSSLTSDSTEPSPAFELDDIFLLMLRDLVSILAREQGRMIAMSPGCAPAISAGEHARISPADGADAAASRLRDDVGIGRH